ncbi:MAG: endonuclease [Muribaculaceae bacterium]|nr:endonuclease [Muribaculaceae bacterium]
MKHNRLYRIAILLVAISAWLVAEATIPSGYYDCLEGKSGQALKDAIHDLTLQHTVLSYYSLWGYFANTDCRPEDHSKVWDMYSDDTFYFRGGTRAPYGMNREHSLPKSWWYGYTEEQGFPSYTDLNHLYPSEEEANLEKNYWPLGEVSTVLFDNGVTRVGYPKSGQGGGAFKVFEPDDRYKGDFARTYFYMACTYQHYTWKYTFMLTNNYWKTLNDWSAEMLCRWARADAVSDKELARNDAVQKSQNNRNPFIDIPTLFEYIWGDRQGQVFYLNEAGMSADTTTYTGDPELITPVQDAVLDFGEVAIGKSLEYTVYIKGRGLNNPLSVQVYRDDYKMFRIPVTTVSRAVANSAEGYPLKVIYYPSAIGEHSARLLISDGGLVGSIGIELRAQCVAVPTLSPLTALNATGIEGTKYIANWTPANEEVDYYIITRSVFGADKTSLRTDSFTTEDGTVTSYAFDDRIGGETHTYYVQSYRLGYLSEPSNVIIVDDSGVTGVEANKPLQALAIDGGILVKCCEDVGDAVVYDMAGRVVRRIEHLSNDMVIELPRGFYLLKTSTSRQAWKIAVK